MEERLTQLRVPFGAYHHRTVPKPDFELTSTGPGTPGGEYLRRFWQPVAFSAELKDLPVKIRIMCEDLVLFRDGRGKVGLLELHCPHRGTSLEFGLVSECGLRCCYHGWLFDVDGRVLETPGEPAGSTLKDRFYHGAYPVREFNGIVFAYMGPPEKIPPMPVFDTYDLPDYELLPGTKDVYDCNWVQVRENSMDPVHTAFLHTIVSGAQFTEEFGFVPVTQFYESPTGCFYTGARRNGDYIWVRMVDFILPNIHQFPPPWETADSEHVTAPLMTNWNVPIDDEHTMRIGFIRRKLSESRTADSVRKSAGFGHWRRDDYEARQRNPWDYDAQVSQRPVAVHSLEHLGNSDRGVAMFRKVLRAGIRANKAGLDPSPYGAEGVRIHTMSQDVVVRVPPAATPEEDDALLAETGQRIAAQYAEQKRPKGTA